MVASPLPGYDDVEAAAAGIAGRVHRTPVHTSGRLDSATGARVFLKCENLQRSGSFKARGAFNALLRLPAEQRRRGRSEEHTSELQSRGHLVCRLLLVNK